MTLNKYIDQDDSKFRNYIINIDQLIEYKLKGKNISKEYFKIFSNKQIIEKDHIIFEKIENIDMLPIFKKTNFDKLINEVVLNKVI